MNTTSSKIRNIRSAQRVDMYVKSVMNMDRAKAREKAKRMSEEERIDYIREHGTCEMKNGLKAVFGRNKYEPKREKMWGDRLLKGVKMVTTLLEKCDDNEGIKTLDEWIK